jgi:hypothetical protein
MRPRKNTRRKNSATDHLDKSPSYHPKGGTSTDVRSPTSTSTEVRSPTETSTSTSTDAYTAGNVTVTGGAGAGSTTVRIHQQKVPESARGSQKPQRKPWDNVPRVHAANKKNPGASIIGPALAHSAAGRKASAALKKMFRAKNPEGVSKSMFEMFHGMPPTEVIEIVERVHVHTSLWEAGTLTSMIIESESGHKFKLWAPDPDNAPASKVVILCFNEKGNQMYFRGGDQSISESALRGYGFKADDFRDHMIIGTAIEVTYRTKKSFEKKGEELVDFYHGLGKEHAAGIYPLLVYTPRDQKMAMYGGRYKVMPYRREIKASPGIGG